MKKKFAVLMAAFLTVSAVVSGCGKADNENASGSIMEKLDENGNVVADSADENAKSDGESTASQSGAPITVVTHEVVCKSQDGTKELCKGTFSEIVLSDDYKAKYPKIAEKIAEINSERSQTIKTQAADYGVWRQNDTYNEDDMVYETVEEVTVVRADDKLFSFYFANYDYAGGAHPNHWITAMNYDVATGEDLKITDVLADTTSFAKLAREKFTKEYPEVIEEVDSYYYSENGETDAFQGKLDENSYSWNITDKGLCVYFSPYEIASYAAGGMEIDFSEEEYPDLLKAEYKYDKDKDMSGLAVKEAGESFQVEAYEDPAPETTVIENTSWKKYSRKPGAGGTAPHIQLTKVKEEKTDWLDGSQWASQHGFTEATGDFTHDDEEYSYIPSIFDLRYDGYGYDGVNIYEADSQKWLYAVDCSKLCYGPDDETGYESMCSQYIRYCTIYEGILYLEIGHMGYASEEPNSSYIVAVDPANGEILFKSEPLTGNGYNFKVVGSTVICGYGFTEEPDYIYLLDRYTGERYDTIPVNSQAYQFEIVDDTLYVATYNTAYEFKISDR